MQKILVVDDAALNRELLHDVLMDDYLVEMAEDGEEAMRKLEVDGKGTAALLLDLNMPRMSGFDVLAEMSRRQWLQHIPVLIISGEYSPEIENRCFEMGVSDFIHKPFESSIVKNRVRNTITLFGYQKRLEQTVEEQAEVLEKQKHIIQMQAEQLKASEDFRRLMMEYSAAIMEVETRLKALNAEFSQAYKRNPFESIKSRLKSTTSIYEKLERRGFPVTVESIRENLTDVAGLRVICSFPDDIYRLAELITSQDDIILRMRKDYIQNPKPNGYRSLHLILAVPIYLSSGKKHMNVEVQFRTIAMDFWASLEHKLKYKHDTDNADEIVERLRACADSIEMLDYRMQEIRDQIDQARGRLVLR